jgi:hypothetical protein
MAPQRRRGARKQVFSVQLFARQNFSVASSITAARPRVVAAN